MTRWSDHDLHRKAAELGTPLDLPAPKPRKKRKNEESRSQKNVIEWWDAACRSYALKPHHLFSIPNGGWRDPVGARILKYEGQRNGVCDLMLLVAKGQYHGLLIEMKTPIGKVSDEQEAFIADAISGGYLVGVCRSSDDAINLITGYLKL